MGTAAGRIDGRSKKRPGVEEQGAAIMQAAVSLFAEQGVRASSIAGICARAGVSRPTFYRCFEGKDALVSRIYEDSVNTFVDAFLGSARLRNPEQLHHQLDELLDSIFAHSELARLVFRESSDPDSPAARIVDAAFEHAADAMTRGGTTHSRVYLKSVMAAVQWIVQDAMRKGLTEANRAEAKLAVFALVSRVLT